VLKFGPLITRKLRQRRPRPSDRWHVDEMVVRIAGRRMYLWRAVDQEGEILDILIQRRRDKRAGANAQAAQEARLRAEIAGHRQAAFVRTFDPQANVFTCSGGKQLRSTGLVRADGTMPYWASPKDCRTCALKPRCTNGEKRIVTRNLAPPRP
jgi:hypothetical protein